MEPTQVSRAGDNPLPVAVNPAEVQLRERAPTLLASDARNDPKAVQIWRPRGRYPYLISEVPMILVALSTVPVFAIAGRDLLWWPVLEILTLLAVASRIRRGLRNQAHPTCISTDTHGIAISAQDETWSLAWNEIRQVERVAQFLVVTPLRFDAEPVRADITGYSSRDMGDLFYLFRKRAGLHPHPFSPDLLLCRDEFQRRKLKLPPERKTRSRLPHG